MTYFRGPARPGGPGARGGPAGPMMSPTARVTLFARSVGFSFRWSSRQWWGHLLPDVSVKLALTFSHIGFFVVFSHQLGFPGFSLPLFVNASPADLSPRRCPHIAACSRSLSFLPFCLLRQSYDKSNERFKNCSCSGSKLSHNLCPTVPQSRKAPAMADTQEGAGGCAPAARGRL